MKRFFLISLLAGCSVFIMTAANSATLHQNPSVTGTVYDTDTVSTWQTNGNTMAGMLVTVNFSGGNSETVAWNGGGDSTGAVGTGWSLGLTSYTENTFYHTQWLFDVDGQGLEVESFSIDALAGNTVFDAVYDLNDNGTPGSELGHEVDLSTYGLSGEVDTAYDGIVNVTYSGEVHLNGTWYGDLYQTLTIDFGQGTFGSNDVLAFYADTDNLRDPVPEPATIILFGAGLMLLAGGRVTRKK
jgi:hypothetical protein